MRTVTTSAAPRFAPANHAELPRCVVTADGDGLFSTWHGSGIPTQEPCGACGNTAGNTCIYGNDGTSYPNGNRWDDREFTCGACGIYTQVCDFTEG